MTNAEPPVPRSRRLLSRLRRREGRRRGFWRFHLTTFASVNAFLAFLNFVTPSTQPWFLYVLGAMSIPLTAHAILKRRRTRLWEKLERWFGGGDGRADAISTGTPLARDAVRATVAGDGAGRTAATDRPDLPDLPDRVFRPLRALHRSTTAWLTFAGVAGTVGGYLVMINVLTGGSFWAAIPVASLALPVFLTGLLLRYRRARLAEQLEQARRDAALPRPDGTPDQHPDVREAHAIRERIVRLVDQTVPTQVELLVHVDEIVNEVERMARLEHGFAQAQRVLTVPELESEREELRHRLGALAPAAAPSPLAREYETSLAQIDRQIADLRSLGERHEIIGMRLRGGVSALRQVSLDLVRLQGEQTLSQLDAQLTVKADELSRYVNDLQESYRELSSDS